ncbi:unnamed protein product, partial [Prorocentrum cordatum]
EAMLAQAMALSMEQQPEEDLLAQAMALSMEQPEKAAPAPGGPAAAGAPDRGLIKESSSTVTRPRAWSPTPRPPGR